MTGLTNWFGMLRKRNVILALAIGATTILPAATFAGGKSTGRYHDVRDNDRGQRYERQDNDRDRHHDDHDDDHHKSKTDVHVGIDFGGGSAAGLSRAHHPRIGRAGVSHGVR